MSDVVWHGREVLLAVKAAASPRLNAATIHLKNRIREKVSRSQPTTRSGKRNTKGQFAKAGAKRGLDPSKPGEYPKIVLGFLRRNISSEYDPTILTGRVGTNVPYGRYLELGTARMKPRPFLKNAIRDFSDELRNIIEHGTVAK